MYEHDFGGWTTDRLRREVQLLDKLIEKHRTNGDVVLADHAKHLRSQVNDELASRGDLLPATTPEVRGPRGAY